MKLFLDDIRREPAGYVLVRSFEDCIFELGTKDYDPVSVEYALSERFPGLAVLQWMCGRRYWTGDRKGAGQARLFAYFGRTAFLDSGGNGRPSFKKALVHRSGFVRPCAVRAGF